VTVENDVCYWGNRSMWPHVFRLLGLRNVRAEVWFADDPIAFAAEELHRKKAAMVARAAVRELKDKATAVPQVGLMVSIEERNG
jgi:1-acyl-sn-glycerol-3-phosphate acyltransferase